MPAARTRGNRPLHACGTRFVSHKVSAISRFVERYGAYINHLIALSEDSSVKSVDKQKLKGYVCKWRDGKILLGCAMVHDLLKPAAILCKTLQYNDVSVVDAIEALLKTNKPIEKLKALNFDELPTMKKVALRIKHEDHARNQFYTHMHARTHARTQLTNLFGSHDMKMEWHS